MEGEAEDEFVVEVFLAGMFGERILLGLDELVEEIEEVEEDCLE